MKVSTKDAFRASRPRASGVAALCAVTASLLFAAAAPAAITTGPVDAASGFPFSYADDVGKFALQQCQDDSGFCIETARPNPAAPISVPDNFTPDGEGFWWLADAEVPNTGKGLARFAKESAFANEDIVAGDQVSFSRIRFRFQELDAGETYRITHPFGVEELVAEPDPKTPGRGLINFTNDVGCITPPCGAFPAIGGDPITAFLQWDPTVAPAAPAGYIGNAAVAHRVIGSPAGTNFVKVEHIVPQPGGLPPRLELVGQTDQFLVQGKLAGPPPPPAPNLGLNTTSLDFGSRQVGSPTAPRTVQVTNHGTADMHVGTLALGGDAADFALSADTCSGQTLAPGAGCSVAVAFAPVHTGDLSASLTVPSDAPGTHAVALSGIGTGAGAPAGGGANAGGAPATPAAATPVVTSLIPVVGRAAPAGAVAGQVARPALRVRGLSIAKRITVARLRSRGLRVAMQLPAGTGVVRIAVFRQRGGRAQGRALAQTVRLPSASGRYVVTLRGRALLRSLRPGRYVVLVTPGRELGDRGATSTAAFTVTR
jgi:hypothetical protein